MFVLRLPQLAVSETAFLTLKRGITYFKPPPDYSEVEFPEKVKLRQMEKVPTYPGGLKPPKMMKNLKFIRGPELVHNTLIHKQFGIVAEHGGRIRYPHFELLRNHLNRRLDYSRMFAVWRVDAPWQPLTKRPIGITLGGGKGNISEYVTPIKAHRVILEVGGKCEFWEVKHFLHNLATKMPFKARVVSYEMLEKENEKNKKFEALNLNPYPIEYIIKNNMLGCREWVKKIEYDSFCKYV